MTSRRVVSEQSAFGDFGMLSVAAFCVTTVCFVTGAAGMLFDPSVKETWGGLLYLFLMTLPPIARIPGGPSHRPRRTRVHRGPQHNG
jgi:hypothetical protein